MRRRLLMANWKMNGDLLGISTLLKGFMAVKREALSHDLVIFPPSIYLSFCQEFLQGSFISWGAQNVFTQLSGAYTGEISVLMLKEFACRYVLVGHSERRRLFQEDEYFIAEKFHQVKEHDMIPVLCVGETKEERDQSITKDILAKQLSSVFAVPNRSSGDFVIAYEPVWAIGTGILPLLDEIQDIHAFIRSYLASFDHVMAQEIPIVYGGSLKAESAAGVFQLPDVDGGLVGAASLDLKQFLEIEKCINSY